MRIIIIAAGSGTRLGKLTEKKPKGLLEINGKSIIERQIEIFRKNGKKHYILKLNFKFYGAKKITGHVLNSDYYIVGEFRKIKEGYVKLETPKLGYFNMTVVDSYDIHNGKKIKFYIEKKHSKKSSSSSSSSLSSYCHCDKKKCKKCIICKKKINSCPHCKKNSKNENRISTKNAA